MKKKSELLIPAGSLDRMKTAILYGADAVYCGTPDMSLRTKSSFSLEDLVEGIKYAHDHGKKVYLTLNLFSHNKDIEKLPQYIETVDKLKPDGLIVADPGIFNYVKKHAPDLELHISTQANICSSLSVDFWEEQGASLVVLAREVSFDELKQIRKDCPDIKIETFVHGSMCMTYSGRCLLSNFMSERGANQGSCAHSCRWSYKLKIKLKDNSEETIEINDQNKDLFNFFLEEEIRPGELMPFEEDMHGSYILNAKDLCLMPKLDQYLEIGIDSLKVEGRNKSEFYAGSVARIYRLAIDDYYKNPTNWDYQKYMPELDAISNRGYSLAFHDGRLTNLAHDYDSTKSSSVHEYIARVRCWEGNDIIIDIKNHLVAGDVLEFMSPYRSEVILLRIYEFKNAKTGVITDVVNQSQKNEGVRLISAIFHEEDLVELKRLLPELTLIRKDKNLNLVEESRKLLHKAAQKLEINDKNQHIYQKKKDKYLDNKQNDADSSKTIVKVAKIGMDGCCGKGCNGCLIFWNDDKYKSARELMKKKKIGEML
ncbi:MAG: putative protease [Rickettsiales bacterium]|jgi:putative protease